MLVFVAPCCAVLRAGRVTTRSASWVRCAPALMGNAARPCRVGPRLRGFVLKNVPECATPTHKPGAQRREERPERSPGSRIPSRDERKTIESIRVSAPLVPHSAPNPACRVKDVDRAWGHHG